MVLLLLVVLNVNKSMSTKCRDNFCISYQRAGGQVCALVAASDLVIAFISYPCELTKEFPPQFLGSLETLNE